MLELLPNNFFQIDDNIIDIIRENEIKIQENDFTVGEKNIIAKTRIGQGIYKERLLKNLTMNVVFVI